MNVMDWGGFVKKPSLYITDSHDSCSFLPFYFPSLDSIGGLLLLLFVHLDLIPFPTYLP